MELKEYRKLRKLSRAAFGKLVHASGVQVWRWETGMSMPKPDTVEAIRIGTGGAVTADDLHKAVAAAKKSKAAA